MKVMARKLAEDAEARRQADAAARERATRDELIGVVSRWFLDEDIDAATNAALERVGSLFHARRVALFAPAAGRGGGLAFTHSWTSPGVTEEDLLVEGESLPADASPETSFRDLRRRAGGSLLVAPVGYGASSSESSRRARVAGTAVAGRGHDSPPRGGGHRRDRSRPESRGDRAVQGQGGRGRRPARPRARSSRT